jgi:hypothetical protein
MVGRFFVEVKGEVKGKTGHNQINVPRILFRTVKV